MDNPEFANNIVAAIRDPENTENISIHKAVLKTDAGDIEVNILAWLTEDMTLSPLVIFCDDEVFQSLKLEDLSE